MIRPSERKLYVSMKSGKPIGVFSSQEKAQAISPDSIAEIVPFHLENSPVSDQYACMVSGSCTLLRRDGDSFFTEYIDIGPFWGVNPQSAAAYLANAGGRSVQCRALRLYRIDHEYAPGQPRSLHNAELFSSLIDCFRYSELCNAAHVTTDFIALYYEEKRQAAAATRKARRPEVKLLTDFLLEFTCKFITENHKKINYVIPLDSDRQQLRSTILCQFSIDELKQLTVLLGLTPPPENFSITDENRQDLFLRTAQICEKLKKRLIRQLMRRTCITSHRKSKKLQDFLD